MAKLRCAVNLEWLTAKLLFTVRLRPAHGKIDIFHESVSMPTASNRFAMSQDLCRLLAHGKALGSRQKSRFVNEKILVSLFSVNQLFLADSSWPDGNLFKRIVPLELTFSTLKK
jgi:hypothetical protein